jgi:hypothetical protein
MRGEIFAHHNHARYYGCASASNTMRSGVSALVFCSIIALMAAPFGSSELQMIK